MTHEEQVKNLIKEAWAAIKFYAVEDSGIHLAVEVASDGTLQLVGYCIQDDKIHAVATSLSPGNLTKAVKYVTDCCQDTLELTPA